MLGEERPIIIVVDGNPIHKAELVKDYVEWTNGMVELYFPALYSTQLNPDEQVWKNVKERVAKQRPHEKLELRVMIRNALERLQQLPEIVRGF